MGTPSLTKKVRSNLGKILRAQGFDQSEYDRSSRTWRVRCPQCEALVINGIPTHEARCPNQPRDINDFQWD